MDVSQDARHSTSDSAFRCVANVEGRFRHWNLAVAGAIGGAFFLYLFTRSNNFNGDGIGHVNWVLHGREGLQLPRYPLYALFIKALYAITTPESPLAFMRLMQLSNAIFACLALWAVYWLVSQWAQSKRIAFVVMATVSVSFVFWQFATDNHHVMMGFLALLLSLVLPTKLNQRKAAPMLVGAASAAGVFVASLCYLANVLAAPAVLYVCLCGGRKLRRREVVLLLAAFCGVGTAMAAGACGLALALVPALHGPVGFVRWVTQRNMYPGWSQFTPDSLENAARGFVNAFQNFYTGLRLRDLASAKPHWNLAPAQLSLMGVVGLLAVTAAAVLSKGQRLFRACPRLWVLCLIWFVPFAVFNTYQCPEDEQYWIDTLVPVLLVCVVFTEELLRLRICWFVPVLLLAGNLSAPFLDWRRECHLVDIRATIEAGKFLKPGDCVIAIVYDWTDTIPVFTNGERFDLLVFGDRRNTVESVTARLKERIAKVEQRGGSVYWSSVDRMDESNWRWVESTTKLPRAEVLRRVGRARWSYRGRSLWEMKSTCSGDAQTYGKTPETESSRTE